MKLIHHSILPFLNEGKVDDLKLKYPSFAEDIDFLSKADTTSTKKTLIWATKILVTEKALKNEIADIITLFLKYENKLSGQEKDINYWKNFTELRDKLIEMDRSPTKSKTTIKNEIKLNGGTKIYEDEQCVLVLVKNKAGACFYGKGTKWCITMSDKNYYEDYTSKNVSFVFLLRKDLDQENPNYKVALVFQRDAKNQILSRQYFDAEDNERDTPIGLHDLDKKEVILSIAEEEAKKQEKSSLAKLLNGEITVDQVPDSDKNEAFYEYILSRDEFKNVKIPEKIMNAYLAEPDVSREILNGIANNISENKIGDFFKKLSNDYYHNSNKYVLMSFASNENINYEIANYLIKKYNNNDSVMANLFLNKSCPDEFKKFILLLGNVDNTLAANPKTDSKTLEKLSSSTSYTTKNIIASNLSTPTHILEKLSEDEKDVVRATVASNPNTPPHILEKLSEDEKDKVIYAVCRNPSSPQTLLDKLYLNNKNRQYIASNKNVSNSMLETLSTDKDWYVRFEVVTNPNVTTKLLNRLKYDNEYDVSDEAKRKLRKINQIS